MAHLGLVVKGRPICQPARRKVLVMTLVTNNDAAGVAALSIVTQLLWALKDKGVLTPKEISDLVLAAYLGQKTQDGNSISSLNDKAQDAIAHVMASLQNE